MPSFSEALSSCIAEAVRTRRSNIVDWTRSKRLLADEFRLDDSRMNVSLVSYNNFQPRLRQKGFDGELDLAVLILDVGSSFTDRVCEGLHRQRSRPDWPLLILHETPSGRYRGERLILGPTNSASLKERALTAWPSITVSRYESVWR